MEEEILVEKTDFEKICDFQNLYKAHIRARRCKRYKNEVIRFEMNLAENLTKISISLKNKTYKIKGYYDFVIYEPKERQIFAAHYSDRVLLHCICDEVITPALSPRLIYDNAACQAGKGTHFAIKRFTKFLLAHYKKHKNDGYVLKCDISKYFASIDHDVLKESLKRIIKDSDVRELIFYYIDSYETYGSPGKGLPLGNQSSQSFAIYYLDPLDRLVKENMRVKHYIRYMDDCILIHPDKAFLEDCLKQMQALIEDKLKLKLNSKTRVYLLKNGVEFLGWKFYLTDTGKVIRKMKKQSRVRFRRRLKKLKKDYETGAIQLEDVKASLASYKGHLMHGHTYKMKQNELRKFVLSKRDRNL